MFKKLENLHLAVSLLHAFIGDVEDVVHNVHEAALYLDTAQKSARSAATTLKQAFAALEG